MEQSEADFKIGDIVYVKIQWAGCSYHYEFGVVERKTPTRKWRIHLIESHRSEECEQNGLYIWHQTRPNVIGDRVIKTGVTVLVDKYGCGCRTGDYPFLFSKWTPETILKNHHDPGD